MSTPNKYQPKVNMPENIQAAYWNGPITRKEAQAVFDDYGRAISAQALAITKVDMVIAYLCDKFGVTPEEIQNWAEAKAKAASEAENGSKEN